MLAQGIKKKPLVVKWEIHPTPRNALVTAHLAEKGRTKGTYKAEKPHQRNKTGQSMNKAVYTAQDTRNR